MLYAITAALCIMFLSIAGIWFTANGDRAHRSDIETCTETVVLFKEKRAEQPYCKTIDYKKQRCLEHAMQTVTTSYVIREVSKETFDSFAGFLDFDYFRIHTRGNGCSEPKICQSPPCP